MTRHSIEKLSFCLYLRMFPDSWSVHFDACRRSVAVHIIRRRSFFRFSPVDLRGLCGRDLLNHGGHRGSQRKKYTGEITHEVALPIGTAFHERTFALCQSLNYREWSGYYTVSVYEVHHEHEYNAIRNACALIDISPLYKYLITGKDATKLVNRVITRDVNKVAVGQVIYACWCDDDGKVIDDGTITRLEENKFRWTAADPSLRWFRQNGLNMDVQIEDISEQTAALALQGPTSGKLLKSVAEAEITNLKYFRKTSGKIAGVPVDISRTGYTGDLGYEIWIPWNDAIRVWDALMDKGKQFDIHAAGMLALDVSRVEAGLLLIEVDYTSSKKALIPSQKYSPYELGFGKMVHLDKENFIGKRALARDNK